MKRFKRSYFLEIDIGGKWRPRSGHLGSWKRWIVGPFSFGYYNGNMNEFVKASGFEVMRRLGINPNKTPISNIDIGKR